MSLCYFDTCSEQEYIFHLCQFHLPLNISRIHLIDHLNNILQNQQQKFDKCIQTITDNIEDSDLTIFNEDEFDLFPEKDITHLKNNTIIIRDFGIVIPYGRKELLTKLDLPETSTNPEIESQVRKLSIKYHPDKLRSSVTEEEDSDKSSINKFHEIQLIKEKLLSESPAIIYYKTNLKLNSSQLWQLHQLIYDIIPTILGYLLDGMRLIKIDNVDMNNFILPLDFTHSEKSVWLYPDPELEGYRSFFNEYGSGIGLETIFKANVDKVLKHLLIEIITGYDEYYFDVKDIYYSIDHHHHRRRKRPKLYIVPSTPGKNTHLKQLFLGNMNTDDDIYIRDFYTLRSYICTRKKNFNIF